MRRRCLSLALAGVLLLPASALGESKSKPPAEAEAAPKKPELELRVNERGPGLPWSMSIINRGDRKTRLTADPRLLWFEVKVPSKRKTQTCKLPNGLFPSRNEKRVVVELEPGEGVTHAFDPRLYCFSAGGQWQLVPGAFVTPHFGWKEKKKVRWKGGKRIEEPADKQVPPFVATPAASEDDDARAGVKELTATPFALRSEYAEWSRTRIEQEEKKAEQFEMKVTQGSDAHAERTATVSIRLKNVSKRAEHVYFRRELVSYEVMGPDGLMTCDAQPDLRAPDRQAFFHLRPGRSITITSRLVEMCPTGTFKRPGLYLVHARFDGVDDGEAFDLDAFMGTVFSKEPATIRIRTGELPFLKKRAMVGVPAASKRGSK